MCDPLRGRDEGRAFQGSARRTDTLATGCDPSGIGTVCNLGLHVKEAYGEGRLSSEYTYPGDLRLTIYPL